MSVSVADSTGDTNHVNNADRLGEWLILSGTTIVVFVNSKSGGKQGGPLLPRFRELLGEEYVYDLMKPKDEEDHSQGVVGPDEGLLKWHSHPGVRFLSCGGDGTGRWILEAMDKLNLDVKPPVATLPLGTGNDISRVLGWGPGYRGESLVPIIQEVVCADVELLDRWVIDFEPRLDMKTGERNGKAERHFMNNYLSIGFADAQVALDFHETRERHKDLFVNRGINKMWYAGYGVRNMVRSLTKSVDHIYEVLDLYVDDVQIDLTTDQLKELEGLVILNLPTYAGGTNMWGADPDEEHLPVSFSDGRIEVIGVKSSFHLTQMMIGAAHGVRLAQGRSIRISYKSAEVPLPGKVDGEPWLQETPLDIQVNFFARAEMLVSPKPCILPRVLRVRSNPHSLYCGWLSKLGLRCIAAPTKRFCVLTPDRLYYYTDETSPFPQGSIRVKEMKGWPVLGAETRHGREMKIEVPTRTYTFYGSEYFISVWIEALANQMAANTVADAPSAATAVTSGRLL